MNMNELRTSCEKNWLGMKKNKDKKLDKVWFYFIFTNENCLDS